MTPFCNITDAPVVCIMKSEVLKAIDDPDLFRKTLDVTEETEVVKCSHCRTSRREIGFPLVRPCGRHIIKYGDYVFDLFYDFLVGLCVP